MIRAGVYRVDFGPVGHDQTDPNYRGHEQRGKRYGIVISPSDSPHSVVTVIPMSTSAQGGVDRPSVDFDGRPTRALVDQVRAIDRRFVGEDMVGYLTRDQMAQVEDALVNYLGLRHAT